ncbi:unnamed protein product [Ectocarpus fasciculatus]
MCLGDVLRLPVFETRPRPKRANNQALTPSYIRQRAKAKRRFMRWGTAGTGVEGGGGVASSRSWRRNVVVVVQR